MKKLASILILSLGLGACQTFTASPAKVIQTERQNITTSPNLSMLTHSTLVASGFEQAGCMSDFEACMIAIKDTYMGEHSKARLATLAELHYAYALYLKNTYNCQVLLQRPPLDPYYANAPVSEDEKILQQSNTQACQKQHLQSLYNALKYSYAYLFYDNLTGETTTTNITNESDIRTQDIYHMAIYGLIGELYLQDKGSFAITNTMPKTDPYNPQLSFVRTSTVIGELDTTTTLSIYLANDPYYLQNFETRGIHALADLTSIYDSRLPNLSVTSSRTGLGVGYVGSLDDRHQNRLDSLKTYTASQDTKERIHPMGHLLMTAIIKPTGETLDEVLTAKDFDLFIFNPYKTQSVYVLGRKYPLFANFSSGYAKWLSDNQFSGVALAQMLTKTEARLPELYMLEPYNPDKKIIIMLHGLASSPSTWVNLTNSLLADPVLRDNYQVWQVFYATNLPILENRYQIQRLITDAFGQYDPKGTHKASSDVTLIAHSMGAVIGRLMLSNDDLNTPFLAMQEQGDKRKITLKKQEQSELQQRLQLAALPQVNTAVFISAPFRGTDYADRWFTRAIRRIIHLPVGLTQTVKGVIVDDNFDINQSVLGGLYLQNGASQLSDTSAFMTLTKDVKITPSVRYHSIMANNTNHKIKDTSAISEYISDGIVPYSSSYLEGADSEIIIDGGHSIHENPKTVLHLRKILHGKLQNPTDKMYKK